MGARLVAPVKRALGYPAGAGVARWRLYVGLCALAAVALVALAVAFTSGGHPAEAAPRAAAGTLTAAAATPTKVIGAAQASSTAASPAITATKASGTPTARPTPSGPPPAPEDMLTFFSSPSGGMLVKRDYLPLGKDGSQEILFTLTGPSDVITGESHSDMGVLIYDTTYRKWNLGWNTSTNTVLGLASPLPAANRVDGYNGGDLLRTGSPIFLMRTTTMDGRAHLRMWKWDAGKQTASPVNVAPAGGGAAGESFDADLDVTVADLDNDGIYEVVADNLSGVQVWKWDGSQYAPEAKR
jgi:hypothetical protein